MKAPLGRRSRRVVVAAATLFALAGGVAYATIPNSNKVYTACMLKSAGTVRLIDPSLPASNAMSHCDSRRETQVTWNQQGQAGPPRARGAKGDTGPQGPPGAKGDTGPQRPPGATAPRATPGRRGRPEPRCTE
jgi:hypothetical protein